MRLLGVNDVGLFQFSGIKIRLSGGNSSSEGRVETEYHGLWGTICDDHWGIDEANVVCRMLGFPGALRAVHNEVQESGYGEGVGPILLDDVKCRGDESTIAACRHKGWGANNCDHSEDAAVVCANSTLPSKCFQFTAALVLAMA